MKEEMQGFHMTPIAEIFLGKKALLNHFYTSKPGRPRKKDCIEEVRQLSGLGMKIPSCFGVAGMAKKVVWHSGTCKKSVLALHR